MTSIIPFPQTTQTHVDIGADMAFLGLSEELAGELLALRLDGETDEEAAARHAAAADILADLAAEHRAALGEETETAWEAEVAGGWAA